MQHGWKERDAPRAFERSVRAVEMARELAGLDRDRYGLDLGKALDGLAVDYLGLGDYEEAVALEEEAILFLRVAKDRSRNAEEDLAVALSNQAIGVMDVGCLDQARETLGEARAIYNRIERSGVVRFQAIRAKLRELESRLSEGQD
jgi:tetratricopeptide (TPR) repeat protein